MTEDGVPAGEPYDWYVRGMALLAQGNADAAAHVLEHAHSSEPASTSAREALARALFDARRYDEAHRHFRVLSELNPDDDYAHFGLGRTLARLGSFRSAEEHLAMAVAMRPDRTPYQQALRAVRSTLRLRGHGA